MSLALEPTWRARLDRVASENGFPTSSATALLASGVAELSACYNSGRFQFPWTRELLAARLHFFFVRDAPKVDAALRDVPFPTRWKEAAELRILDVGAGLGASTLGAVRALRRRGVSAPVVVACVDHDPQALSLAREVLAEEPGLRVQARAGLPPSGSRFDLVVVANVIVEAAAGGSEAAKDEAALGFLRRLVPGTLAEDGLAVVVEPALRPVSRRLQRVRDAIDDAFVVAPCTHGGSCPLLRDARDWCHDDLRIDLPFWLHAVAKAAGLRWQGLTFSRLVLSRMPVPRPAFRVVAPPRDGRGRRQRLLCGDHPDGSTLCWVDQLSRHDGPDGEAFAESARGDGLALVPKVARVGPGVVTTRWA